jgi:hypothetical protein
MAQFQIRGGQTLKVVTRKVANIIFDTKAEVTLQYTNYYYSPKPSSPEFLEKQKTGIEIDAIRSRLIYNLYEIDHTKNTTTKYFRNGAESGRDIATGLPAPNYHNYTSLFDEHEAGSWYDIQTPKNHGRGEFVVLEGNFRKTATMPIVHEQLLNDAFHFHLAGNGIHADSTGNIEVNVYKSADSLENAEGDLEKFYLGTSSELVHTYQFTADSIDWKIHSINLREIDISKNANLLWFTFERTPIITDTPFDHPGGEYDEGIVPNGSDTFFISSVGDWTDSDTITVRPITITRNSTPPVVLVEGTDFEREIISYKQDRKKLKINWSFDLTNYDLDYTLSVSSRTTQFNSSNFDNNWLKFSHDAVHIDGRADAYPNRPDDIDAGGVSHWQTSADQSTIEYVNNSRSYVGAVTPDNIETYILEAELSSTAADDDGIGLVIGYVKDQQYEYTLSAIRTQGGILGGETWAVVSNLGTALTNQGEDIVNPNISSVVWSNSTTALQSGNWSTGGNTKIRIEKTDNIVKVWTSQFGNTTIDDETLIEINLNDSEETKKFITSRTGFSTWGQTGAKFSNIVFTPYAADLDPTIHKQGYVGVGGFAVERSASVKVIRSPKENHEFIETISSERFTLAQNNIFLETYDSFNFELNKNTNTIESQNIIELIQTHKLGYTILDYNNINMIVQSAKTTFEFSPFTGARGPNLSQFHDSQLILGGNVFWEIENFIEPKSDVVYDRSIGNYKVTENVSAKTWEVSVAGIKYTFDYSGEHLPLIPPENFTGELANAEFLSYQSSIIGSQFSISDYLDSSLNNMGHELTKSEYIENVASRGLFSSAGLADFLNITTVVGLNENINLAEYLEIAESEIFFDNVAFSKSQDSTLNAKRNQLLKIQESVLNQNKNQLLRRQDVYLNLDNSLYFFERNDVSRNMNRIFYFGKPLDTTVPINLGFQRYKSNVDTNERFIEIARDTELNNLQFIEQINYTMIEDTKFVRKTNIIEFEYPKTAYFEAAKDIEFIVKPFYTETLDKTYVHKLFFVDLNLWNADLEFKPFELQGDDTVFMIEQFFLQSATTAPDPTNLFKHLMIEEIFRPNYRLITKGYEFFFDSFIGISSNLFDANKFQPTYYETWNSSRRRQRDGGSQAFGHVVLRNTRSNIISNKTMPVHYITENSFGAGGRHGRSRTGSYKETQIVTDTKSNFLFEFSDVDWNLDLATTNTETNAFRSKNNFFNFVYTLDETSGRIPDCLTLTTTGRLYGTLSETDKFIREYAWEQWTKEQGYTDKFGNFISHYDSIDYDYTDFDMISPREFTVKVIGKNITKGTIDLIRIDGVTEDFALNQEIHQDLTTFFLDRKVGEFEKEVNHGNGLEVKTVLRYEIDRLEGDINVTKITENTSSTSVTSLSILNQNIANIEEEIMFSEDLKTTEVLNARRADLIGLRDEALNRQAADEDDIDQVFVSITTQSGIAFETVENAEGIKFRVDDFSLNNAGAVTKEVTLIFRIINNFTFDKDLFLNKSGDIDTADTNRKAWLEENRKEKNFTYDPVENNSTLDESLINTIKEFRDEILDNETYLEERDIIFEGREYVNTDQKNDYKKYINSIIGLDVGGTKYVLNEKLYKELNLDYVTRRFPLSDLETKQRFLYLENISVDGKNEKFKLNCSYDVSEDIFYDNTDDILEIRGYPVYASCN